MRRFAKNRYLSVSESRRGSGRASRVGMKEEGIRVVN